MGYPTNEEALKGAIDQLNVKLDVYDGILGKQQYLGGDVSSSLSVLYTELTNVFTLVDRMSLWLTSTTSHSLLVSSEPAMVTSSIAVPTSLGGSTALSRGRRGRQSRMVSPVLRRSCIYDGKLSDV